MKKYMLATVVISVILGVFTYLHVQWREDLAFYTSVLETYEDFNGAEVDELWRFRNENATSPRFEELYAKKVKPLSGGDWSSSHEDVRWRRP